MAGKKSAKQPANGQKKKVDATLQLSFNDMMKFFGNLFKSGMEFRQTVNKMIDQKMEQMVEDGKYTKAEAKLAGEKLKKGFDEAAGKFTGRLSDSIRSTLNRMNIATLDDIKSLETRLDTMIKALDNINLAESSADKSKTSKTTAGKKAASSTRKKTAAKSRKTSKSSSGSKSGTRKKPSASKKKADAPEKRVSASHKKSDTSRK